MVKNKLAYLLLTMLFMGLAIVALYFYFQLLPRSIAEGDGWKLTSEIKNEKIELIDYKEFNNFLNSYIKLGQENTVQIANSGLSRQTQLIESLNIVFVENSQGNKPIFDIDDSNIVLTDCKSIITEDNEFIIYIYLNSKLFDGSSKSNQMLTLVTLQQLYGLLEPISPQKPKENWRANINRIVRTYTDDGEQPIIVSR